MTKSREKWVIGIDEVGRGPLAGPVMLCAVAVPMTFYKKVSWSGLTDSKLMTKKARETWFHTAQTLVRSGEIRYKLASQSALQIDKKGIAVCIRECVASVLKKLAIDPAECCILLDGGLKAPAVYLDQETIIKGDRIHQVISFASVIAKVTRDRLMQKLHTQHPLYDWHTNKGYGTKAHRIAIKAYKTTVFHRMSFLSRILDK